MRDTPLQRQAEQAVLDVYARVRGDGETHERALGQAILLWLRHHAWADGREARIRVRQILLAARMMAPCDFEDWIILASGDDVWDRGAPAAIHRLSIDCRALGSGVDPLAARDEGFESAGAEVLRDYLRTELPRKVARLRQMARELLPREAERATGG